MLSFKRFGIDISKYQKGIDFDRIVDEGVKFIILRGAYHLSKDTEFENFYKKAKDRNIDVGVYLYTMAKNPDDARQEALFLINDVLKGKRFELPVYFDIEDDIYYPKSRSANNAIVKAFCDTLEKNNYFTGIYASKYFFGTYLDDSKLKMYTHWVAHWVNETTYKDKNVMGMWQFGGSTNEIRSNKIAGYVCDQNYMYKDFPKIIKEYKLNGYGEPIEPPKPKEIGGNEMTRGYFMKGDKNEGVYLLKQNILALKSAGVITQGVDDNNVFGDGTEIAVKQIQKASGLKQDGFAGALTLSAIRELLENNLC